MSSAESQLYTTLLYGGFIIAGLVFILLFWVSAPYGRHGRGGWGPVIPARCGWIVMEAVSLIAFCASVFIGHPSLSAPIVILVSLWAAHYTYRAFVYPFRIRARGKTMPVFIMCSAIFFNSANGYLNGRHLGLASDLYDVTWLTDPRFIVGVSVFVLGAVINQHADAVLLRLRTAENSGYKIPHGGSYRWVSCPNYLGEIIEWVGWAIATWSVAGLFFALSTAANLIPRARDHHQWYKETFEDYPAERKALLPFLF